MANEEHLEILKQGVEVWNKWREEKPEAEPDLSGANLSGANLEGANLWGARLMFANLSGANLSSIQTNLWYANLSEANLKGADLSHTELQSSNLTFANLSGSKTKLNHASLMGSDLSNADLSGAEAREIKINQARAKHAKLIGTNLQKANLKGTDFWNADFSSADLTEADISNTNLSMSIFKNATLVDCKVFGVSAWEIDLDGAIQKGLRVNLPNEPQISVENLEVAQFVYLLLNNEKIRHVIDTITSKVVLILGRFTKPRKAVLEAIRNELRKRDYLPILFDFEKPSSRDLTETISTLAHMARFIVADITEPNSIPQELQAIVPNLPSVPIQPLLLGSATEYGMFEHFRRYPWVLEICRYHDADELIQSIQSKVITPAEEKAKELVAGRT